MIVNKTGTKKFIAIAIFISVALCACQRAAEWRQARGAAWGTTYSITYKGDKDLGDSVVAAMRQVERELSMFDPQSTVSRINANRTDTVTAVFRHVFNAAKRVAAVSGGAFDPTVAPLVDVWGFGRDKRVGDTAPDSAAIDSVLASVGIADCSIDAAGLLTRKAPGAQFDFSAIAKGYGVDCVAAMLERNGCSDYMVEIGGEVSARGLNPRGQTWRVQVDDPVASGRDGHVRLTVVALDNTALATSGNYRNYRTLADGTRVSHTLSAATGRPVRTALLSVSVLAPTCMMADALATACMAMAADSAVAMMRRLPDASALFVIGEPGGGTRQVMTGTFARARVH